MANISFLAINFEKIVILSSFHLNARIVSTWPLCLLSRLRNRYVLRNGIVDAETHGIFHFFLDTAAIGADEGNINTDENDND